MASGVNTAVAAHSVGMIARCERPCARKPGTPNSAAKPMPSARCHPVRASSGSGTAPATGPDGAIRYSALRLSAQRNITSTASKAAVGTAAVAAAVRQAIAMVAPTRMAKTMSAAGSCRLASTRSVAAMRYAPSDADETSSISSGAAGGPNRKPDTIRAAASAKPMTTWNRCAPSAATGRASKPGKVQSALKTIAVIASHRHIRMRASRKAAAVTIAR